MPDRKLHWNYRDAGIDWRSRAVAAEADLEQLRGAARAVVERLALSEDVGADEYEALRCKVER